MHPIITPTRTGFKVEYPPVGDWPGESRSYRYEEAGVMAIHIRQWFAKADGLMVREAIARAPTEEEIAARSDKLVGAALAALEEIGI